MFSWKSSSVAEGYLEDSIQSKNRIARSILSSTKSTATDANETSSEASFVMTTHNAIHSTDNYIFKPVSVISNETEEVSILDDLQKTNVHLTQNFTAVQNVNKVPQNAHTTTSVPLKNSTLSNSVQGASFSNLSNCSFHIHNYYSN